VLPEILVRGGARRRAFLFSIITLLWVLEDIPADITDPNITILFNKGDRAQCGNYNLPAQYSWKIISFTTAKNSRGKNLPAISIWKS